MELVSNVNIFEGSRVRIHSTEYSKEDKIKDGWYSEGVIISIEPFTPEYSWIVKYKRDKLVMNNIEYKSSWMIGKISSFFVDKNPSHNYSIELVSSQLEIV